MQLFLLDHIDRTGNDIIIDNPDIRQQAKKVLRLQGGDQIFVQDEHTRYEVAITKLQDMKIYGTIKNILHAPKEEKQITMIVAMPNKREKAELIVQKLTEIGVSDIIFRPSERSVIKQRNSNKEERLKKITKEALEQSRGRHVPKISFTEHIEKILEGKKIVLFDKTEDQKLCNLNPELCTGLIGPEGGRGPKDYQLFETYDVEVKDLGATMLRMETAAIVGGRLLKNGL